jgi:hypothetical protein
MLKADKSVVDQDEVTDGNDQKTQKDKAGDDHGESPLQARGNGVGQWVDIDFITRIQESGSKPGVSGVSEGLLWEFGR